MRANGPQAGTSHAGGEWLTGAARAEWLKAALALALASGMLLSLRLWLSDRDYPLVPVLPWLPAIPAPLDWIWLGAVLLLLGLVAAMPRPGRLIAALLGLALLLCAWDQSRWQPWAYVYLCMLGALGAGWWNASPDRAPEAALNICRLIMAATYFWSGVQKLNASFVKIVFPWLLEPLTDHLAWDISRISPYAAVGAALLEGLLGVGLVTRRFRNLSVVLVVIMHLLILLSIGPLGQNWNVVVWPWNLAMMSFVVILFWRTEGAPRAVFPAAANPLHLAALHLAALLLFGLLPALSFFEWWDDYLSASLYSGTPLRGSLDLSPAAYRALPEAAQQDAKRTKSGRYVLDLTDWSMRVTNVPAYPARRVMRRVAESLAAEAKAAGGVVLVVEERPTWLVGNRKITRHSCGPPAKRRHPPP